MISIGEALKALRVEKGRTQAEVAHDSSVPLSRVRGIETGRIVPVRAEVLKLAIGLLASPNEYETLLVIGGWLDRKSNWTPPAWDRT